MASLKLAQLAQQSQNLGHYAHAVDLYQKLLENPNLSKKEQLEISWNLSRSYRFGGHYSMALMALKKQTDGHSCFQAHFEEGASWQDLDCTLAATSCYQKALDLNRKLITNISHVPKIDNRQHHQPLYLIKMD